MKNLLELILLIINLISSILFIIGLSVAPADVALSSFHLVLVFLPFGISLMLIFLFIRRKNQKTFDILFLIVGLLNAFLTLNGFFGLAPNYFSIFSFLR